MDWTHGIGFFAAFCVFLLGLAISIVWVFFPFILGSHLKAIERSLDKQNKALDQIADRQNETNKALQWLIENWKR
jgi:hypothetical protein